MSAITWEHIYVFYWVVKAILWPFLRIFRPWAEGTENVPREGPAIIASNHLSFSDHFFAPLPLPRKVVFLAKSEYFTGRGLKGLISKAFFSGVGQIPVDRSGGEASERALRTGLRVLAHGDLLGIYPEGTRSPDGRLYRGKTGVARLALEAKAPVVPCAASNSSRQARSGRGCGSGRASGSASRSTSRATTGWRPTGSCSGRRLTRSCTRS
jgi:1-acyl-sn-glycerol-3-phosphate acyltransferase